MREHLRVSSSKSVFTPIVQNKICAKIDAANLRNLCGWAAAPESGAWLGRAGIGCVSAAVVPVGLIPLVFDHANAFSVGRTRGLITTIKLCTYTSVLMDKCCLSVWGT